MNHSYAPRWLTAAQLLMASRGLDPRQATVDVLTPLYGPRDPARSPGEYGLEVLRQIDEPVATRWAWVPTTAEACLERAWIEGMLDDPERLTVRGVLGDRLRRDHEHRLTPATAAFDQAELRRSIRALHALGESAGARPGLATRVARWWLELQVDGAPFRLHHHPFNQVFGVQSYLPSFMSMVHPLHDAAGAQAYVDRVAAIAGKLDQCLTGVAVRAEQGIVPPRFVLDRVIHEAERFAAVVPRDNHLVAHFVERAAAIPGLAEAERERLVEQLRRWVGDAVAPAYRRVALQLGALRSRAPEGVGVWALPRGEEYYAWLLRSHTSTALTPEQIHRIGVEEVERLEDEIRQILGALGQPTGHSLREGIDAIARDPRQHYPEDDAGRAEVLADFESLIAGAQERLAPLFGAQPRSPVTVQRVPAFMEATAPIAFFIPPGGDRPSTFAVNLGRMGDVLRYQMPALAYHEAFPGHHLQAGLQLENAGLPAYCRELSLPAYVEGWGLYAETLAAEQGLYHDTTERLGYLGFQLLRAARLVTDTGLHYYRWTREHTVRYLGEHTALAYGDVVAEVERYVVLPAQACAYTIGHRTLLDLREQWRARQGARFELRRFHDRVLGMGAVPLEVLRDALAPPNDTHPSQQS